MLRMVRKARKYNSKATQNKKSLHQAHSYRVKNRLFYSQAKTSFRENSRNICGRFWQCKGNETVVESISPDIGYNAGALILRRQHCIACTTFGTKA